MGKSASARSTSGKSPFHELDPREELSTHLGQTLNLDAVAKFLNPDGSLDIRCYFHELRPVAKEEAQMELLCLAGGSTPSLNLDLGNLYNSGHFSDVSVVCCGKSFSCHRNVLAARSPVFMAMFAHEVHLHSQLSNVASNGKEIETKMMNCRIPRRARNSKWM